jgi:hypothetical protein
MSEERRKRQQERQQDTEQTLNPQIKKLGLVALIIAVVLGLYAFVHHHQSARLNAFAQCLNAKGTKMYGAFWCPHCADQKEMFGSSFKYVNYVECGVKGSRTLAQVCTDAGIQHFPTWVFADGTRVEGAHQLDFLGQETGCALP